MCSCCCCCGGGGGGSGGSGGGAFKASQGNVLLFSKFLTAEGSDICADRSTRVRHVRVCSSFPNFPAYLEGKKKRKKEALSPNLQKVKEKAYFNQNSGTV